MLTENTWVDELLSVLLCILVKTGITQCMENLSYLKNYIATQQKMSQNIVNFSSKETSM